MVAHFFIKGSKKFVNIGRFVSDIDGHRVLVLVDSKLQYGGSPLD